VKGMAFPWKRQMRPGIDIQGGHLGVKTVDPEKLRACEVQISS